MTGRRRTDAPDQAELDRKRALNALQVVEYLAAAQRREQVAFQPNRLLKRILEPRDGEILTLAPADQASR